jgi:hypothetical protein
MIIINIVGEKILAPTSAIRAGIEDWRKSNQIHRIYTKAGVSI